MRLELRLRALFEGVTELIVRERPGADARIALSVGQARGAVLVAAALAGIECFEYAPARVKQATCGHGRADKAQIQRMVKAILGLKEIPTPDHAADALAVAICHATASPLERLTR